MKPKNDLQVEFAEKLKDLINKYKIKEGVWAVGVSGGADSLALVYLLNDWLGKNGGKIVALTVNHGLRDEAGDEAAYVADIMKKADIEHHILCWQGEKPKSGIEEVAREARYALLGQWCENNGVENLFIAHHQKDQAETFLMRLQRGSGVDGLSAMFAVSRRGGINILRPLLQIDSTRLREYLSTRGISWVEDPSNQEDDYLRVKVRKLLPYLEEDVGMSVERIAATASRMARVRDYLEQETDRFIEESVQFWNGCGVSFDFQCWNNLHEEIALRVVSRMLKLVGKKIYPPRMEEIERLYEALKQKESSDRTLCNCEILKFGKRIWIVWERKNQKVLSKKEWDEFCMNNPKYKGIELPYKLRADLVLGE